MARTRDPAPATGDAAHQRLIRDFQDVQQQFAATSEILTALGRAGADPSVILDTIVERVRPLCDADVSQLYLIDDGVFRLSRISGAAPPEFIEHVGQHPLELSRDSLLGRVALD